MSDRVAFEPAGDGVTILRLNRPSVLNALDNATVTALGDALEVLAGDGATRAVVVAGDARAFAAGGDIAEFATAGPRLEAWDRIWATPLPLVGAVRGLALGGGLELAMSCDLLVVADDARLGQPEITLGLIPGAGGTQRLTRAIGKALASEMVLLGRELSGREAERHGLVSRCVPSERVEKVALEFAQGVARLSASAARAAKRALSKAFEGSLHAGLLEERAAFYALLQTADAREGVEAFLNKRKPVWKR